MDAWTIPVRMKPFRQDFQPTLNAHLFDKVLVDFQFSQLWMKILFLALESGRGLILVWGHLQNCSLYAEKILSKMRRLALRIQSMIQIRIWSMKDVLRENSRVIRTCNFHGTIIKNHLDLDFWNDKNKKEKHEHSRYHHIMVTKSKLVTSYKGFFLDTSESV